MILCCHFLDRIASNGTVNLVESLQTVESDHTLLIILGFSMLGHAKDAAALILREDVTGARQLRRMLRLRSLFGMALLQLLQGAVMESTFGDVVLF